MAGPVKTVCFIASAIIAWGLFVIGEPIVAWFDYKINGTEIPWNMELLVPHRLNHMMSILYHGLLIHGIRKETTKAMLPWISLYYFFLFVGLCVIWVPRLTSLTPISSHPSIVSTRDFFSWFSSVYLKISLSKIPYVRAAHMQIPNFYEYFLPIELF